MMMDEREHFPSLSLADRARASTRQMMRSGRVSPSHSAHGCLVRATLLQQQNERKARKVRFFRNGDRFYPGIVYAISAERFRTLDALLAELTASPLGDKSVLPKGVRYVFTADGRRLISSLDELEEGESYVCASTRLFKALPYSPVARPDSTPHLDHSYHPAPSPDQGDYASSLGSDENKDFIKPKLITVVRHGSRPRKAIRLLLNKKTVHSFSQVLGDITEKIQVDSGSIKKLYTADGKQVTSLQDFFKDDSVFVAYGNEKFSHDDFDMEENEVRYPAAYSTFSQKERVTLKSPKPQRKLSTPNGKSSPHPSPMAGRKNIGAASPKSIRKNSLSNQSPVHKQPVNGHSVLGKATSVNVTALKEKYIIGKTIGEGNFAVVKECTHKVTQKQFALKIIRRVTLAGRAHMIDNEVAILRRAKHPNIIQLVEEFDSPDELYLIMELVNGGDLLDAITSASKYTEQDASSMMFNLTSAIKYLHERNIVHRDIKPDNLLLCVHSDGTKSLKLGDFGLATEVHEPLFTVCGTPSYVAPEVLKETGYGVKVDIWSAGVIAYVLLCGFLPFVSEDNNQEHLFEKIMSAKFEFVAPHWNHISDTAKNLVSHMLVLDVDDRFSAAEVLSHPWVSENAARDEDLHSELISQISTNFSKSAKKNPPGVAVIVSTALDKGSRYFQGCGAQIKEVKVFENRDGVDEIF